MIRALANGEPASDEQSAPRPLLITPNCSMRMGGEAALAFHFFRVLRARDVDARVITHARNRPELEAAWPDEGERIYYIEDDWVHRVLYRLGLLLPDRADRATFGFLAFLYLQRQQRRLARRLIGEGLANLIHQPAPVSPAQPSLLHGLDVPVVIGPLNGGMDYPEGFRDQENKLEWAVARLGRRLAGLANLVWPGKRRAAMLLVANERSRRALPRNVIGRCPIVQIPENGVDLSLWHRLPNRSHTSGSELRFVFVGRLVAWKGVDLLLEAWSQALRALASPEGEATRSHRASPSGEAVAPPRLVIIGDGPMRRHLEQQRDKLGLRPHVEFTGWLPQDQCARHLAEADVLVHPSLMDCGAAVVLEAMAAGIPVIATAWGGPTDYVTPDCGILVPALQRESFIAGLSEAMVRLAESPQLRVSMGAAGRGRVARYYDWGRKAEQILNVYRMALAGERAGEPGHQARLEMEEELSDAAIMRTSSVGARQGRRVAGSPKRSPD